MHLARGLLLGCLLLLAACQRKAEIHADPGPSVQDAAESPQPAGPQAKLDGQGFHALGETVSADQQRAVSKLFGDLRKRWPDTFEVELAIAPEITWQTSIVVLDASRMQGYYVWALTSGTAKARIDAPKAASGAFPPAGGESKDADPCAFAASRLEVGATDYAFNGLDVADLEALDAKLTSGPCPEARVIVMADGRVPTGRVVTAIARVLSKNRKVALGVAVPAPLPPPKR
jgi:hypothetical protein